MEEVLGVLKPLKETALELVKHNDDYRKYISQIDTLFAKYYMRLRDYDTALTYLKPYEGKIELNTDPNALYNLALIYEMRNEYKLAREAYENCFVYSSLIKTTEFIGLDFIALYKVEQLNVETVSEESIKESYNSSRYSASDLASVDDIRFGYPLGNFKLG